MSGRWVREARRKSANEPEAPEPLLQRRLVRPLGQGAAFDRWVRAARRLQLPHGVLVEGGRGVGKTTAMQWLAAALLCPSELDPDEPCGMCNVCTRIANRLHADVHVLERAQDEQERTEQKKSFYVLTVDQVLAVEEALQRSAVEGRARVCLIADADYLAEVAQNKLLKTLEEPGRGTFLLLEASRPEQLLETVRSRVQRLRLLRLPDDAVRSALERTFPHQSARFDSAVSLARGSLGLAQLALTERAVQLHDLVRAWFATTQNLRPVATARSVLEGVGERHEEIDVARLFLLLLRAELQRRRDALVKAGDDIYGSASLEPWTTWLEHTLHAERDLDLLIPPEQALTACLVQLCDG